MTDWLMKQAELVLLGLAFATLLAGAVGAIMCAGLGIGLLIQHVGLWLVLVPLIVVGLWVLGVMVDEL